MVSPPDPAVDVSVNVADWPASSDEVGSSDEFAIDSAEAVGA